MANKGSADLQIQFEEILCPCCGTRPFRSVYTVQDRLHPETARTKNKPQGAAFRIVACSSCGFLYLNPRPISEHLQAFYRSEKYDPHIRRGGGWFGFLYRRIRPLSIHYKAALVWKKKEPGTLLDIGCGTGEFLQYMKRRGWRVLGVRRRSRRTSSCHRLRRANRRSGDGAIPRTEIRSGHLLACVGTSARFERDIGRRRETNRRGRCHRRCVA